MIKKCKEDMDLKKIASSGQCFRAKEVDGGAYRFVYKNFALYISKVSERQFEVSCSSEEWENVWVPYFDLDSNYESIKEEDYSNPCLKAAIKRARGIRILRQDPWECLISFIISQRKNIPSISSCIGKMCEERGSRIQTPRGKVSAFPAPNSLEGDLEAFKLGYREKYVMEAAKKVASGKMDLEALSLLPDAELKTELKNLNGVGEKIANCVALFAYHKMSCAPVDTWIKRAINEQFGGTDPFPSMGKRAGILQQYVYYSLRTT